MTIREHELAHAVLEVIDFSDNGVSLLKIEEVLMSGVRFGPLYMVINDLFSRGLIRIDANHVAHRVKEG